MKHDHDETEKKHPLENAIGAKPEPNRIDLEMNELSAAGAADLD